MRSTRTIRALATATATLALVGTAGAASAQAIPVGPLSGDNTYFGTNWGAGAPQNPGTLTWNVGAGGTISPQLDGNLYLKNSLGVNARAQIQVFDAAHQQIGVVNGFNQPGIAGLAAYPTSIGGAGFVSNHVHVRILNDRTGSYQDVDTAFCTVGMAAC